MRKNKKYLTRNQLLVEKTVKFFFKTLYKFLGIATGIQKYNNRILEDI